jgi:hypothetical protein
VRAAIDANAFTHIDLTCLPAILHNRPERIPEAVRASIRENRPRYGRIAVAYADCGTGGMLDRVCEQEGVTRIAGPHCYAFYSGTDAFLAREDADMDAFFLTDFLARQFEAFVIEPLGSIAIRNSATCISAITAGSSTSRRRRTRNLTGAPRRRPNGSGSLTKSA